MKQELFRVTDLNYSDNEGHQLNNISFYLTYGDHVALLGLEDSGKGTLVDILTGNLETSFSSASFTLEGKRLTAQSQLTDAVYRLSSGLRMIANWTIAEYLFLPNQKSGNFFLNSKKIEKEAAEYLQRFGIELDAGRQLSELTELERWLVDLTKALIQDARILIIEDEFEGMREDEIELFSRILREIAGDKVAVLVNSYSDVVSDRLSDRFIIFNNKAIVKKCKKDFFTGTRRLDEYLFSGSKRIYKGSLDVFDAENTEQDEIVYRIFQLPFPNGTKQDVYLRRGSVTTFLISNEKQKTRFFNHISGLWESDGTYRVIGGKRYYQMSEDVMVQNRMAVITALGDAKELFSNLNLGDNLLLPSLQKISRRDYWLNSGHIASALAESFQKNGMASVNAESYQDVNDRICMTLERWFIFRPRILFLLEPFARCDAYGSAMTRSYIRKFAQNGTAVVIVKSRIEYVEDLSHQIISLG